MSFPAKFRKLIELREDQVTVPDYVWLSYAVCAAEEESCGWRGWIIEAAFKHPEDIPNKPDLLVEADNDQRCPDCGRQVYRTGVEKQYRLNPNAGPKITYPFEAAPVTYTKSKSAAKRKQKN